VSLYDLPGNGKPRAGAVPAIALAGDGTSTAARSTNPSPGRISSGPRKQRSNTWVGGTVTGTEIADEESYHEIEVTVDDGRQVDVQLDEGFKVVGT
jgi:hypothetical protein